MSLPVNLILALTGAGLVGSVLVRRRKAKRKSQPARPRPRDPMGIDPEGSPPPHPKRPVAVLARGSASNPRVRALLDELSGYLRNQGVDTDAFSAEELTLLRRSNQHAIPDRTAWPSMAFTIRTVAQPLREFVGKPLWLGAFRPKDYNDAAGGADNSRHMFFSALDLRCPTCTSGEKLEMALEASRLYLKRGGRLRMGLGIYSPHPRADTVHVDTGWEKRYWKYTKQYLDRVNDAAIA